LVGGAEEENRDAFGLLMPDGKNRKTVKGEIYLGKGRIAGQTT